MAIRIVKMIKIAITSSLLVTCWIMTYLIMSFLTMTLKVTNQTFLVTIPIIQVTIYTDWSIMHH